MEKQKTSSPRTLKEETKENRQFPKIIKIVKFLMWATELP